MAADRSAVLRELLDRHGRTYAEEAGIRLADKPGPLYQLLVLATLLSARISADVAVAAARELFAAGCRSAKAMREASWQDRVDALGRGHYRRYDERTSTMLGNAADLLHERWRDDLRRLRDEAGRDPKKIGVLLTEFPGIGPTGADIFLREVQTVWTEVAPHLGRRPADAARRLGLPGDERALGELAGSPGEMARVAAALMRVSRESAKEIREAAGAGGRPPVAHRSPDAGHTSDT